MAVSRFRRCSRKVLLKGIPLCTVSRAASCWASSIFARTFKYSPNCSDLAESRALRAAVAAILAACSET